MLYGHVAYQQALNFIRFYLIWTSCSQGSLEFADGCHRPEQRELPAHGRWSCGSCRLGCNGYVGTILFSLLVYGLVAYQPALNSLTDATDPSSGSFLPMVAGAAAVVGLGVTGMLELFYLVYSFMD